MLPSLALVLLVTGALGPPFAPGPGATASPNESANVPVAQLDPVTRHAWDLVRSKHPHAKADGWVLKRDWSNLPVPSPGSPRFFFTRVLPNGAMALDWAEVEEPTGQPPTYHEGVSTRPIPLALIRRPRLSEPQAWSKLQKALLRELPGKPPERPRAVFRLLEDDADPSATGSSKSRLRLVYHFIPPGGAVQVCVDAQSGEIGHAFITTGVLPDYEKKDPYLALWDRLNGGWLPPP